MSVGGWLWKEAKMPITETRWWGDVISGKKPLSLQSHNAIHADSTRELGNNWVTRNPDATAAMVLATIFSGGAASGAVGGAEGGAAAGGAAAGGSAAAGSGAAAGGAAAGSGAAAGGAAAGGAAAGSTAAGTAAGSTAAYGAGAEAGTGLAAGGAGASGSGLAAGAGEGYAVGSGTGAAGNGLMASGANGAAVEGASTSPGLLSTAGQYANTGLKTAATAQQAKGLLAPTGTPQAQAAPVQNKPADFSGLLKQYANDDKWSQQYAQYVQGLLGGYRG